MSTEKWNKIYIAGAGPGSVSLLTVRAQELIRTADVILHDDLVSAEILAIAPAKCELLNTGKRAGDGVDQAKRQNEIVQLLEEKFRAKKNVLRLKGGDPMIFGRGVEEYAALGEKGIPVEIIPGISAGIASGSIVPLPLTERAKSESVLIITGSTIDKLTRNPEVLALQLKSGNTAILYMGHSNLKALVAVLLAQGVNKNLPLAAVSKVSLPDQRVLLTTISDFEDDLNNAELERPIVFAMGTHIRNLNFQLKQE